MTIQEMWVYVRGNTTDYDSTVKRVEQGNQAMGESATSAAKATDQANVKSVASLKEVRTEAERTQVAYNTFVKEAEKAGTNGARAQALFNKELDQTRNKIGEIIGLQASDKVGSLRGKFGGMVSDEDLLKLKTAQTELKGLERSYAAYQAELRSGQNKLAEATASPFASRTTRLSTTFPGVPEGDIAKLAQVEASLERIGAKNKAIGALGSGFMNASAGVTLLAGAAVEMGAAFESSMVKIQNNTTMSDKEAEQMRQTVVRLGKEGGAGFDDLAAGYMHIKNFGYGAADATNILEHAMKSAVSTGTKTAEVADILARDLHGFRIPASQAGEAMNVLHLAAAQGNMTLAEFVAGSGRAFAMAANLGLSLTDTAAAMSALTRAGFTASQAQTQLVGALVHTIQTTPKAQAAIAAISKASGIDLVTDFTMAGLKAKGFEGVMEDVAKAVEGHRERTLMLIPALRGGIGAMALAGNAGKDYKDILESLNRAMRGEIDPTTEGYNRTLHTLTNEFERAGNEIRSRFIGDGKALHQTMTELIGVGMGLANAATNILHAFTLLPPHVQELIMLFGAARLLGAVTGLNVGISGLTTNLKSLMGGIADIGKAGGLVAFLGGWEIILPVAAALGVLAGAMYLVAQAMRDEDDEAVKAAKATHIKAVADKAQAESLFFLIAKHDELSANVHKTADETKALHDIDNKIAGLAPNLVRGFDDKANAVLIGGKNAQWAAEQYKKLADAERIAAMQNITAEVSKIDATRARVKTELDEQQRMLDAHTSMHLKYERATGKGGGHAASHVEEPATTAELVKKSGAIRDLKKSYEDLGTSRQNLMLDLPDTKFRISKANEDLAGGSPMPGEPSARKGGGKLDLTTAKDRERAARDAAQQVLDTKREGQEILKAIYEINGEKRKAADLGSLMEFQNSSKNRAVAKQAHDLYILQLKQHAKEEIEERKKAFEDSPAGKAQQAAKDQYDKAREALISLRLETATTADKTDVHRVAVDLLGVAYEKLPARVREFVNEMARIKKHEAEMEAAGKRISEIWKLIFEKIMAAKKEAEAGQAKDDTILSNMRARLAQMRGNFAEQAEEKLSDTAPDAKKAAFVKIQEEMKALKELNKARAEAAADEKRRAEEQVSINNRLKEAQADMHREMRAVLHTGTDYESMLGRLNLASKSLTDEQKKDVQALTKQQQALEQIKVVVDGTRAIFHKMFTDILSGSHNFFKSFLDGFKKLILDMAANKLTDKAMQGLTGMLSGLMPKAKKPVNAAYTGEDEAGGGGAAGGLGSIMGMAGMAVPGLGMAAPLLGGLFGRGGSAGGFLGGLFGGGKGSASMQGTPVYITGINPSAMTGISALMGGPLGAMMGGGGPLGALGQFGELFSFFDDGGYVPGRAGRPVPAIVHGGEFVVSRDMMASGKGGGSSTNISVNATYTGAISREMDTKRMNKQLARSIERQIQSLG